MKPILYSLTILSFLLIGFTPLSTEAKTLEVQTVSNSNTLPRNGVRIPLVQITMRASEENATVTSLTLSRSGLSSHEDIGRVWVQQDYIRLSQPRQFTNDDLLTLEFKKPFVIKAGTTERFSVLANLEFEGSGRTLQVNVEAIETDSEIIAPVFSAPRTKVLPKKETTVSTETTPRIPGVFTTSKSRYDRSAYQIVCRNSRCQLVKK